MRKWSLSCPYCNVPFMEGNGYGDVVPPVFVPYLRCQICGRLSSTGANEFICMNYEQRLKIRASLKNCEYIEQSLDRTNNQEYREFLTKQGFKFFPITDDDKLKFKNVDFNKYQNADASYTATQGLYNIGILIKEEEKDTATGGIKAEILANRQKNYRIIHRAKVWGTVTGIIVGILSSSMLMGINPNSYLSLLGILIGFITGIGVSFGVIKYYGNKEKKQNSVNVVVVKKQENTNSAQADDISQTETSGFSSPRDKSFASKNNKIIILTISIVCTIVLGFVLVFVNVFVNNQGSDTNSCYVTFDQQGGTGGSYSVNATYNCSMPSATKPSKKGYTFLGYYSQKNGKGTMYYDRKMFSTKSLDKKSSMTLYAYWRKIEKSGVITLSSDNFEDYFTITTNCAFTGDWTSGYTAHNGYVSWFNHKVEYTYSITPNDYFNNINYSDNPDSILIIMGLDVSTEPIHDNKPDDFTIEITLNKLDGYKATGTKYFLNQSKGKYWNDGICNAEGTIHI